MLQFLADEIYGVLKLEKCLEEYLENFKHVVTFRKPQTV